MMLPARACWPPNSFTPRRLLSLSRPLRDEPPAFLCAMTKFGPDYLALGAFLEPPLAGAAFSVEVAAGVSSLAVLFLPLGFLAGLSAPAASSLVGAGLAVGLPAMSPEPSSGVIAPAGFSFAAFGSLAGTAADFAGFSSFWSPIATIFRIVCCWRCPFLRR